MYVRHSTILVILTALLLMTTAPLSPLPTSASETDLPEAQRAVGDGDWSSNMTVEAGSGLRSPSVALANGTLHVAFLGDGVGYSRSTDGGAVWSEPITLGPEGQDTPKTPSIAANGDTVIAVWSAKKDASTKAIYWARSLDGGLSFEDSEYLAGSNGKEANQPKVRIVDGTVYLLWADNRDDPLLEHELYLKKSTNGGDTWGIDKRVTDALKDSFNPDFEVVGATIHVVWEDERDGPHWTYYKRSTDGGSTFGTATAICNGIEASMPNLAVDGTTVHVTFWQPSFDLYYLRSDDNGDNWGTPSTIVSGASATRSEGVIEAQGTYLEFIFNEEGDLLYMNSSDGGASWSTPVKIGEGMSPTGFEGYWMPHLTRWDGTFLVYSKDTEIIFRYKGLLSDLAVAPSDISFEAPYRSEDDTLVNVSVTVHNTGDMASWGSEVLFYDQSETPENLIDARMMGPLAVQADVSIDTVWVNPTPGHLLKVRVDGHGPMEITLDNNLAETLVVVPNHFPIANLSVLPNATLTNVDIEFDATSSQDPYGSVVSYWYDFGDGSNSGWVSDAVVHHSYGDDGNYTASLRVKDGAGAESGWRSKNLTIENRGPLVDLDVLLPHVDVLTFEAITFSANLSDDTDGAIISYDWDLGDGNTSNDVWLVHEYADDGNYTVRLTITDDDGIANVTEVDVDIWNRPPEAVVWTSTRTAYKGETIHLDASNSSDMDGTIGSYLWSFGDSTTAPGAKVEHVYRKAGSYEVGLVILDDDGAEGHCCDQLFISVIDRLPVANISVDKEEVMTMEFLVFDATGSLDPDGKVQAFHWDFGDGTTSLAPGPKHSYQKAGTYLVVLTVTDDVGQNDTANVTIRVLNRLPSADARADRMVVDTGEPVNFTGMFSKDEDGLIVDLLWDFGDGANGSGRNVSHTYAKADNYTIVLTVMDDQGGEATASIIITVKTPYVPPPPPNGNGHEDKGRTYLLVGACVAIAIVVVLVLFFVLRGRRARPKDMTLDDLIAEHPRTAQGQSPQQGHPETEAQGDYQDYTDQGQTQCSDEGQYGTPPPEQYEAPPPEGTGSPPPDQFQNDASLDRSQDPGHAAGGDGGPEGYSDPGKEARSGPPGQ